MGTKPVEQRSEKLIVVIKIRQVFFKSCREVFLVHLDKILLRSYQDLPWNVAVSSYEEDFSGFARNVKIMHVLSRSIKFRFTVLLYNLEFFPFVPPSYWARSIAYITSVYPYQILRIICFLTRLHFSFVNKLCLWNILLHFADEKVVPYTEILVSGFQFWAES